MSEEEIIKYIKDEIENETDTFHWFDDMPCKTRKQIEESINAHQGLLDLYNKEKEKNKELENADLTIVYMNGFYDGEKKWKDKIREVIKQLENDEKKTRDKKYRELGEYILDYDKVRLKAYITKTKEIKNRLQELLEEE